MSNKSITGECPECESVYNVYFQVDLTSKEIPQHCPFCGELISEDELTEEYIDDEDLYGINKEWDN